MTKNTNLINRINAQFNLCNATLIVTRQYRCGRTFGLCYRLLQGGVERKGATLLISMKATSTMTFVQLVRLLASKLGIASELDVYQSIRVVPGKHGSYEIASVIFPAAIAPNARAEIFAMLVAEHATLRTGEEGTRKHTHLDYFLNVQVRINGVEHSKLYPSGSLDFVAAVYNHQLKRHTAPQIIRRSRIIALYKASIVRLVAYTNK